MAEDEVCAGHGFTGNRHTRELMVPAGMWAPAQGRAGGGIGIRHSAGSHCGDDRSGSSRRYFERRRPHGSSGHAWSCNATRLLWIMQEPPAPIVFFFLSFDMAPLPYLVVEVTQLTGITTCHHRPLN